MFGGTPSNLAISLMKDGRIEVIAGVNLPMLVKLSSVRGRESLEDAVAAAQTPAANISASRPGCSAKRTNDEGIGVVRREVEVVNERGLHARVAARIAAAAEGFDADIRFSCKGMRCRLSRSWAS